MKKRILLILFVLVLSLAGLAGCKGHEEEQVPDDVPYVNPVVSQGKNIFVSLPLDRSIAENHVRISGLTTLDKIKVEVYDEAGNLLNENNTNIELFNEDGTLANSENGDSSTWKSFNKYLYFNKKPATASGTVKIFSDEKNMVKINIQFISRLKEEEVIKVLYPEENETQKGVIRVYGYASVYDGLLKYEVRDKNGKVLAEGNIQATSGKPDTGLFAKDISLDADSQEVTLILTEAETFEGKEPAVIEIPVQYQK